MARAKRIVWTPRVCTHCKETYFRRNLTELWTARNPGHRRGWSKTVAKLCMKCLTISQAQRVMVVAHIERTPEPAPPTKA
jgi:hypothetical protein